MRIVYDDDDYHLCLVSQVINAHKLGAKAVIIVNTEDKSTMRLKALPGPLSAIHTTLLPLLIHIHNFLLICTSYPLS